MNVPSKYSYSAKFPKRGARKRYERERNEEIKTLDHQTSVRKYNRLKMIHIKHFFIKIETNFKLQQFN